jgi:hypothetical protein
MNKPHTNETVFVPIRQVQFNAKFYCSNKGHITAHQRFSNSFSASPDERWDTSLKHFIRTPLQISTHSPYVNIFISNSALELYTGQQITYASVHHSKRFTGQHHILVFCATFRITSSAYPNINNAFLHYRDTHLNDVGVRKGVCARSSQKYLIQKPYAHSTI